MPYKDIQPYYRTWIKRELISRLDRYAKKTKTRKIDIISDAVDKWLKENNS